MTPNYERDLGRVLADIEYLKQQQIENKQDIKEIKSDLSTIKDILSEAKGRWKALVIFGSICSVAGGLIVKFLGILKGWAP